MSVTIDHEELNTDALKLHNLGQVFQQLQNSNRLIVRIVVDGEAPDLTRMAEVREAKIKDHTVFIETADPLTACLEVLVNASVELDRADKLKEEASNLLRANKWAESMECLRQCLKLWQGAQSAIVTVAKAFKIDPEKLLVAGRPLRQLSSEFARQLRDLQSAIQATDLVAVSDVLTYETAHTGDSWRAALESLRAVLVPPVAVQSGA
jgi:hypothetical protein